MAIRFDDIGNRLKAFRLAFGLSADEIAQRLDISRAAVYRFERGELVKIETLEKLSELLGVSVPTLLGVGVEYLPSAVAYFERIRQVEETASHIIVLAGPISYLLASPAFHERLAGILNESVPDAVEDRKRALADVTQVMNVLAQRKEMYAKRRPTVVNLLAASEVGRLLQNGLAGRFDLPQRQRRERRAHARHEVEHLLNLVEEQPIDVQIGIVPDTLPHTGFQIFRQPDREVLTTSPFRLGEHPNVRVGVAMVTSAPEALTLHHRAAADMWRRASRGAAAVKQLKTLLQLYKK
jgi:transcriptional regulator with XRE-family HTH domain